MRWIYWSASLVQETNFWCTYKDKTSDWGRRRKHWPNSWRHSGFKFSNLGAWHCLLRSKQLLFRVKKWWLYTRGDIPDWSRVRKATFFTRCISPGSSATPCLIWLRWRLGPLHTDSYAGIPMNHNYLNISIIRKMLANSYIISKTKVSQLLYSIQS